MSEPLYKMVADQVRQKINSQEWTTALPSEATLCAMFGVSRITLRRAIQELCDEGLVTKRQGLGMFVERDDYSLSSIKAGRLFSDHEEKYKTLQIFRNRKPDSYVSRILHLEGDERVAEAQRLRYYQDEPAIFLTVQIPETYYRDGFFEEIVGNGLVIPAMSHLGIEVKRTVVTVEPVILKEKQPLLHLEKGETALLLHRVGFTADDTPVLYIEHLLDGKKSKQILKIHTTL